MQVNGKCSRSCHFFFILMSQHVPILPCTIRRIGILWGRNKDGLRPCRVTLSHKLSEGAVLQRNLWLQTVQHGGAAKLHFHGFTTLFTSPRAERARDVWSPGTHRSSFLRARVFGERVSHNYNWCEIMEG